jgi:hypothetical protein
VCGEGKNGVRFPTLQLGGGEQRQLIDRQWPLDRGGDGEDDSAHLACLGGEKQLIDLCVIANPPVGQRPWQRRVGGGANREQHGVVGDLRARLRIGDPGVGVDTAKDVPSMRGTDVTADVIKRDRRGRGDPEAFRDGERGQDELVVRGNELELDAPVRQLVERQHSLHRPDAPTGDYNLELPFIIHLLLTLPAAH